MLFHLLLQILPQTITLCKNTTFNTIVGIKLFTKRLCLFKNLTTIGNKNASLIKKHIKILEDTRICIILGSELYLS